MLENNDDAIECVGAEEPNCPENLGVSPEDPLTLTSWQILGGGE